jgi:cytochrome c peroxidase
MNRTQAPSHAFNFRNDLLALLHIVFLFILRRAAVVRRFVWQLRLMMLTATCCFSMVACSGGDSPSSAVGSAAPGEAAQTTKMAATMVRAESAISEDEEEAPPPIASLKSVEVPAPAADEIGKYVKDKTAAVQLGKALFWDTRVGSDNKTACATCHFHAGADNRTRNQINPGLLGGDKTFQLGGPNHELKASDFPLTKYSDVNDVSTRTEDRNDVVSSQGIFTTSFVDTSSAGKPDSCTTVNDAVEHGGSGFNMNGVNTRRVEPRNTPSVINAIFNFRNFWDGRANNMFNGSEPFGLRNTSAQIWINDEDGLHQSSIALPTSALASLGSGPPVSENEMSCRDRSFAKLGQKLVHIGMLSDQKISHSDSVLGNFTEDKPTYATLIRRAFKAKYWDARSLVTLDGAQAQAAKSMDLARSQHSSIRATQPTTQVSQMEANFALFFGIAIQSYQSTLISDDTPFDRYAEGDKSSLNAQQLRGMEIFRGPAQCVHCHAGPEFTSASFANLMEEGRLDQREGRDDSSKIFRYDNGFFNTGVRPTGDDPGVGGTDPFGYPLSESLLNQSGMSKMLGNDFDEATEIPVAPDALLAIDGTFKTPGLRNVEFTGPYFHNGGQATLMQLVDFYNRGGDFRLQNEPVPDPTIKPLDLTQQDKEDLVAFLLALSDERVRYRKAPFDHPSICIPQGHEGDASNVKIDEKGNAVDGMQCRTEVGAKGAARPLGTFLDLSPFER